MAGLDEDLYLKEYQVARLSEDSEEFKTVATYFRDGATGGKVMPDMRTDFLIQRIARVHNPMLWTHYHAKFLEMRSKLAMDPYQDYLFHGTSPQNVDSICLTGFHTDRAYQLNGHVGSLGIASYFTWFPNVADRYVLMETRNSADIPFAMGSAVEEKETHPQQPPHRSQHHHPPPPPPHHHQDDLDRNLPTANQPDPSYASSIGPALWSTLEPSPQVPYGAQTTTAAPPTTTTTTTTTTTSSQNEASVLFHTKCMPFPAPFFYPHYPPYFFPHTVRNAQPSLLGYGSPYYGPPFQQYPPGYSLYPPGAFPAAAAGLFQPNPAPYWDTGTGLCYMFMAQVLVGTSATGPRDGSCFYPLGVPTVPALGTYDSTEHESRHILAVFNSTQIYPKYVIEYRRPSKNSINK